MGDELETIHELRAEVARLTLTLEAAQAALADVIQNNTNNLGWRRAAETEMEMTMRNFVLHFSSASRNSVARLTGSRPIMLGYEADFLVRSGWEPISYVYYATLRSKKRHYRTALKLAREK